MLTLGLLIAAACVLVSFATALIIRRRAGTLGLVAQVNERSSHSVPTPSGGGMGIVLAATLAGLFLAWSYPFDILPVLMAGLLIAVLGYWDDRRPLPAKWRLGAHVVVAGAVTSLVPLDVIGAQVGLPLPEPAMFVALVLAGALWINLYNFMDGIDGLAASEAIFLLVAALGVAASTHPGILSQGMFWWMAWLAAACLGFLLLNWAPARIFMGDAGSTYLGLMLFFFALATTTSGWLSLAQWVILVAAFLADSLTTLLRRALRREPVWQAHKRHAYQHLQRRLGSHAWATLIFVAVNVVVLLPLAVLAGAVPDYGWAFAALAYVVLVPAAIAAGAGAPLEPEADEERPGADDR
jgi:Fuc2NAc and GlcNAc transferase